MKILRDMFGLSGAGRRRNCAQRRKGAKDAKKNVFQLRVPSVQNKSIIDLVGEVGMPRNFRRFLAIFAPWRLGAPKSERPTKRVRLMVAGSPKKLS
jgi:hypothetical protein